jgi:hypothetical protein
MKGHNSVPPRSRRRRSWRMVWTLAALALMAGRSRSVSAEAMLEFVTTGSVAMTQGNTGTLAITVTNAGTSAISLTSFSVGLQLIADGLVAGSLTFGDFLGTGSVWTDPTINGPDLATLDAPVDGTTEYYAMTISGDFESPYVFAPATSAVLGTIQFTASGDAVGTWSLFAVNEWPNGGVPISFVSDDNFEDRQMANLSAAEGLAGVSRKIGTIAVAVPEPSALALLVAATAVAGLRFARRRMAEAHR